MEDLQDAGLIRAIGVSNFQEDRIMDLIAFNRIAPVVNQVETHPFHQQRNLQKFLTENHVQIESWGPFAEGRNNLFSNSILQDIASRYDRSVAQVVLRWLIQRQVVTIPKSINPERIRQNFAIFDFQLTDQDMSLIATLDTSASLFADHRDPARIKWIAEKRFKT